MQTRSLAVQSGELVMGACQVQKLLFPRVACALLVLACSLSFLVCPQTWSVTPASFPPFAPCPQPDVRKAEHLPQLLSCSGPKGPALVMYAKLLKTSSWQSSLTSWSSGRFDVRVDMTGNVFLPCSLSPAMSRGAAGLALPKGRLLGPKHTPHKQSQVPRTLLASGIPSVKIKHFLLPFSVNRMA